MRAVLSSHGTIFQHSCPHTHEQNGVAERKHRHILDTTRALLLSSFVPPIFWAEAVLTSVNLINMNPSSVLPGGISPHECLLSTPPDYSLLRTFGCTCFVLLPPPERSKLSAVSTRCVLLGLSIEHKGYRCYDPLTRRLRISRHVSFLEHVPYFQSPPQDLTFLGLPPSPSSSVTPSTLPFFICHSSPPMDLDPFPSPSASGGLPLPSSPASTPVPSLVTSPNPDSPLPPTILDSPSSPPPFDPFVLYYTRHSPDPDYVPSASPSPSSPATSSPSTTESSSPDGLDPPAARYPRRDCRPVDRYGYTSVSTYFAPYTAFLTALHTDTEPTSFRVAIRFPQWQKAMAEEFEAFREIGT